MAKYLTSILTIILLSFAFKSGAQVIYALPDKGYVRQFKDGSTFLMDSMYSYNYADGREVLADRYEYRFDNKGKHTNSLRRTSNKASGGFSPLSNAVFEYNDDLYAEKSYDKIFNTASQTWEDSLQTELRFDADGLPSYRLVRARNMKSGQLSDQFKTRFFYNASGTIDSTLEYEYLNGGEALSRKAVNAYNGENIADTKTYKWNPGTARWSLINIKTYRFDGDNKLKETLSKTWNPGAEAASSVVKTVYEYNTMDKVARQSVYNWDENTQKGDLTGYEVYEYNADKMMNQRISYLAGKDGKFTPFNKRVYFWSVRKLISTQNIGDDQAFCTFPNPFSIGQTIRCSELKEGKNYQIEWMDINGHVVLVNKFNGPATIVVSKQLTPGAYFMTFRQNGQLLTTQKVIVQ